MRMYNQDMRIPSCQPTIKCCCEIRYFEDIVKLLIFRLRIFLQLFPGLAIQAVLLIRYLTLTTRESQYIIKKIGGSGRQNVFLHCDQEKTYQGTLQTQEVGS